MKDILKQIHNSLSIISVFARLFTKPQQSYYISDTVNIFAYTKHKILVFRRLYTFKTYRKEKVGN